MTTETSNHRTRFYNRLVKGGLIGGAAAFGSLIAVVFLPLERNVGMVIAGVGVLALIMSAFIMMGAIAARDIPTWKKNRWRFSISTLLSVMMGIAMVLGSITAAQRNVGAGRMLIALAGFLLLTVIANTIYINWCGFAISEQWMPRVGIEIGVS